MGGATGVLRQRLIAVQMFAEGGDLLREGGDLLRDLLRDGAMQCPLPGVLTSPLRGVKIGTYGTGSTTGSGAREVGCRRQAG